MARGTNAHDLDALTHTWMPEIAGSTPVARRGFSVMKPLSVMSHQFESKSTACFSF